MLSLTQAPLTIMLLKDLLGFNVPSTFPLESLTTISETENLKKGSYDVLFDRFYRLDSSRNSETGGFGIGLSIAKAIVQKHGGEIKAYSPDGERMVFKLEI